MSSREDVEGLLRELAPQALGALARRHGRFDTCEDAVQEALLAAALQWPTEGVPESPIGWLLTVAERRLTDEWRSDSARRLREESVAVLDVVGTEPLSGGDDTQPGGDDTLALLFLCCHPALSAPSQLALTLRAVGGLTTGEIASAFLVPEATMAQRISRAKQSIKTSGVPFALPPASERAARLRVVLQVLYLIFNEGYTDLLRTDLAADAVRLTRLLLRLLPDEGEVAGLLALMLLTDARRAARIGEDGMLVPLAEQRRELWDAAQIEEGVVLLERAFAAGPTGPYQLQAAIAALHDEAPTAEETDWPQIVALYWVLERVMPSPIVTLNRAVAVAMVDGPEAGLRLLESVAGDESLAQTHRVDAVRGHLLELAGDLDAARECYRRAAKMTTSMLEQRYLTLRAASAGL